MELVPRSWSLRFKKLEESRATQVVLAASLPFTSCSQGSSRAAALPGGCSRHRVVQGLPSRPWGKAGRLVPSLGSRSKAASLPPFHRTLPG